MNATSGAWQCEECGRSPPAVSFPDIDDGLDGWVCRECRTRTGGGEDVKRMGEVSDATEES